MSKGPEGFKIIAIGAIGFLLGIGLCGAGFYESRNIHDGAPPDLAILGAGFCVLSLLVFAVGLLIAVLGFFSKD